jgi:hypothetical protein
MRDEVRLVGPVVTLPGGSVEPAIFYHVTLPSGQIVTSPTTYPPDRPLLASDVAPRLPDAG